jgi:iron complex outermembrane receptor protein
MRKFFFSLLAWIAMVPVFSSAIAGPPYNGTFSGEVTDVKTGLPIQGASVYFTDIRMGCSTDANGGFVISNISEGMHLVEVSHIGYSTIAENILVEAHTKKHFSLTASIIENNAVIVTGVSKASQLKKVPFQVSVIRKEEMLQTTSTNIIESITRKAGVSSLSTGPAISKPLIRGLGYNRVLTINDGVRQEGQQWGDEHGIEIDESGVSKIEVLKGPASLVYGSDAMAGVINIISNSPAPLNTWKMNAGSGYQSNNRSKNAYGSLGGNRNGFSWNAYGSVKEAGDYKNKFDGYVFNSKFNEHNAGGYAGYNGNWGFTHLLVSSFDLKAGLVEGERDDEGFFIRETAGGNRVRAVEADFKSTRPAIPYQHIRHFRMATDNNFQLGKNRLSLNVGWQRNRREEFGNPEDLSERALFFDLKTITYTAQLHLKEMNGWKTSLGINGMQQRNTNRGVEQLIPDYRLFDVGSYVFLQKEFKKLSLSGGTRFDSRNVDASELLEAGVVKTAAFKRVFSNYSGSAGATYAASKKVNLKLNIARAFRAPGIAELASNGAHEGTIRYEYGDQQLYSETSLQADAAVEYSSEHFSLNIAGYINRFNRFIFYRKLASINGGDSLVSAGGEELTAFKFDQRRASLAGMEVTLDIHPHPLDWLHIENTFSLVSGKLKEAVEGSRNLPFMPAPKLFSELRADFKKLNRYVRNFYVKLEIDNTFKQSHPFTAYNTETATKAYTLLNAGAGTMFYSKKNLPVFGIYFSVMNVADIAYQNHLSRLKYAAENMATGRTGVFNMGRNFSIKLNVPLSFKM